MIDLSISYPNLHLETSAQRVKLFHLLLASVGVMGVLDEDYSVLSCRGGVLFPRGIVVIVVFFLSLLVLKELQSIVALFIKIQ